MPLAKDHRRQRHEATPGAHVRHEGGILCQHQIASRKPAQKAVERQGCIAQPGYRDAGGVDHLRVFADRAQAQAESGAVHQPPDGGNQRQRQIDQRVVAQQALAQCACRRRHVGEPSGDAGKHRMQANPGSHRGRLPALREPCDRENRGHSRRDDVHRDARHHLIAVIADAGQPVQPGKRHRDAQRQRQRDHGGVEIHARSAGRKRRQQHLALKPDVDDAGALGQQAGQRAQDQRRGDAQRRGQQRAEQGLIHAPPPAPHWPARWRPARAAPRAPAHRPWRLRKER